MVLGKDGGWVSKMRDYAFNVRTSITLAGGVIPSRCLLKTRYQSPQG